jgi:hypothetical protein
MIGLSRKPPIGRFTIFIEEFLIPLFVSLLEREKVAAGIAAQSNQCQKDKK